MKKLIVGIAAVLVLTAVLTACGKKQEKNETTAKEPAATTAPETTVVTETTAGGGRIEKDAEGNELEIDKNGSVVSIKDKNGKEITLTEYVEHHHTITSDGTVVGAPKADEKSDDVASKAEGGSSKGESADAKSETSSSKSESSSSKAESQSDRDASSSEAETIKLDEYELPIVRD